VAEAPRPPVHQVDLALDQVRPGGGGGVLEIGHEHLGAGIERIDDHLAVGGAGDLDAAIEQVARDRADPPVPFADRLRLGQEIRRLARIEAGLPGLAGRQQLAAAAIEPAMQLAQEGERVGGKRFLAARLRRRAHFGGPGEGGGVVHGELLWRGCPAAHKAPDRRPVNRRSADQVP